MDRYSRQRLFPPIGDKGQTDIRAARIALIGCGALGTHIAQHLARAGVGYLRICDRDFVELNNLQRQVLFDEKHATAGMPKAIAARESIARINSDVTVDARVTDVTARTVLPLLEDVDLVIDGTDNFETRYLLNDACVSVNKPWIYGGVVASHGMVLAVIPGETPCFACVMPEMPPPGSTGTCDTAGVIGPAVGIVAAIEATEALKLITGHREALHGGLQTIDPWRNQYRGFKVARDSACAVCAKHEYRFLNAEAAASSTVLCGRDAVQITPADPGTLDFARLEERLSPHGDVSYNDYLLRFAAGGLELTLFPDGRAVIKGTDELDRARSFYARFIGS